jgi:uncharacterized RDD family membrane protein YckC
MNCPLCGEICTCLQETTARSLPRWVNDAANSMGPAEPGVDCPEVGEGSDTAAADETPKLDSAVEEEDGFAAGPPPAGDVQTEETAAWRGELANRLSLYRARRKARPPRYPSLRLVFDQPAFKGSDGETLDGFSPISQDALALDSFSPCDPAVLEAEAASAQAAAPTSDPVSSLPATQHQPQHQAQHGAKIIEFPRLTSAAPPIPLNELAEPVSSRPRILDVPDIAPPLPALGGITIESAQVPAAEKRPGIDIPLQSAPLGRRLIASLIDVVIIGAACAISGLIFWKITGLRPPRLQLLALAAVTPSLLWMAYQYLLLVYAGSTPGLRLAKLELTGFSGKPASRNLRRWRVFASYLSALSLGMGYAWLFLDEDSLCWHDRITHTYLAPKRCGNPAGERSDAIS